MTTKMLSRQQFLHRAAVFCATPLLLQACSAGARDDSYAATALGIRNAMLNQPVEVAAMRPRFAASMGIGSGRPDLVVRFGRGPALPRSLRRPVTAVLV